MSKNQDALEECLSRILRGDVAQPAVAILSERHPDCAVDIHDLRRRLRLAGQLGKKGKSVPVASAQIANQGERSIVDFARGCCRVKSEKEQLRCFAVERASHSPIAHCDLPATSRRCAKIRGPVVWRRLSRVFLTHHSVLWPGPDGRRGGPVSMFMREWSPCDRMRSD